MGWALEGGFSQAVLRYPPNAGATLGVARVFAVAWKLSRGRRARIPAGQSEPDVVCCFLLAVTGVYRS